MDVCDNSVVTVAKDGDYVLSTVAEAGLSTIAGYGVSNSVLKSVWCATLNAAFQFIAPVWSDLYFSEL